MKARKFEADLSISNAWHAAAWQRTPKMPPLSKVIAAEPKARKPMNRDEMKASFRAWKAALVPPSKP